MYSLDPQQTSRDCFGSSLSLDQVRTIQRAVKLSSRTLDEGPLIRHCKKKNINFFQILCYVSMSHFLTFFATKGLLTFFLSYTRL